MEKRTPTLRHWEMIDELLRSLRYGLPNTASVDDIRTLSPLSHQMLGTIVSPSTKMVEALRTTSNELSAYYRDSLIDETPFDEELIDTVASRYGEDAAGLALMLISEGDVPHRVWTASLLRLLVGLPPKNGVHIHSETKDGVQESYIYARGEHRRFEIVSALDDVGAVYRIENGYVIFETRDGNEAVLRFDEKGTLTSVVSSDGRVMERPYIYRILAKNDRVVLEVTDNDGVMVIIVRRTV